MMRIFRGGTMEALINTGGFERGFYWTLEYPWQVVRGVVSESVIRELSDKITGWGQGFVWIPYFHYSYPDHVSDITKTDIGRLAKYFTYIFVQPNYYQGKTKTLQDFNVVFNQLEELKEENNLNNIFMEMECDNEVRSSNSETAKNYGERARAYVNYTKDFPHRAYYYDANLQNVKGWRSIVMPMARGMSFKVFMAFLLFALFLSTPSASAAYSGLKVTTEVVPGSDDFFVEISAYGFYSPKYTPGASNLTVDEFSEQSFMFYVSEGSSCIVWQGDYSSEFHRAFYSNGSWYLLLQGGYPLLRIDGKPFPRVYPYNLTYTSITIYRIKNGCIEPSWIIPTSSQEIFGSARLENNTVVLSSYSETSWRGFKVNVPLKSFERYVSIINASAFAESLVAVQLSNGNIVIFFPKLYYFRVNGTVYGGMFEGNFTPVFRGNETYVFVYRGSLRALPVVRANLNLGKVFPDITTPYSLRTLPRKNSTGTPVSRTPSRGSANFGLVIFSLGVGVLIGAIIGYGMGKKKREVKE